MHCLLTDRITDIILVDALAYLSNRSVYLVLPVFSVSTFFKRGSLFLHSTSWRRTTEVVCFFEAFSNSIDIMAQILYGDDTIFAKILSNQCVTRWVF